MRTINETELSSITGGRNKLAYKIGHYTGKAIVAGALIYGLM